MHRNSAKRLSAFLVSVGFALAGSPALFAAQTTGKASSPPKVRFSARNRTSAPLRDYRFVGPLVQRPPREIKNEALPVKASRTTHDPAVQREFGISQPIELSQFEGGSDADNQAVIGFRLAPPDNDGDVGPNDYVQYINLIVTMYDKSGGVNLGPLPGNAFWSGFGGPCETQNDGDPIVLYDQLADRWFVSQFAFPNFPSPPYIQCVAVSTTGDPTGSYNQYQFDLPDQYLNDYPKFGVWPDGYYMTFNGFDVFGGGFQGGAVAFDRQAMLDGNPATMIQFDTGLEGGVLPSDLDGSTPPPIGSPNYFVTYQVSPERLLIWQFHADFATPANSTFTGPVEVLTDPFTTPVCGSFRDQCVPQLDSPELLETLSQATMFRLAYRNFGDHESLVTNQTVDAGGQIAGIRWYEIRNPGGTAPPPIGNGGGSPVEIYQQGTFAPDDGNHRWMGSIAQDRNGNMALGYSISSETMHPSIAITGRLAGDPPGQMGAEDIFLAGTGSQVDTSSRWGDYTFMAVDPADDCTFWYTNQYYQNTGSFDWNTRIASFKFPSCTAGPTGTLEGTVTDGVNPIEGVKVAAGLNQTVTNAAGHYTFTLPIGTYDMTATKYGYFAGSADDVPVNDGETTTQDFELTVAPTTTVNGTVKDAGGGWPLYARIAISATGFAGATVYTDPVTGYYQTTLVVGLPYTFVVTAISQGYETGGGIVDLSVLTNAPFVVQNWTLTPNPVTCNAPGYTLNVTGLFEDFGGGVIPPGWNVENNSTDGGQPWIVFEGADPCGQFRGNLTGGSGPYAIVNSNCDGFVTDDTNLITPSVDLSSASSPVLRFASDYNDCCDSTAAADISDDGGTTWSNVFLKSGSSDRGPKTINVDLSSYIGEADVRARFHFDGFYAWWWQVDNVILGDADCVPGTGGLVVGNVRDASNGAPLNGATVENLGGASTKTFATPTDPNQDDGLYILYAESGNQTFKASSGNYAEQQKATVVVPAGTTRLDFSLLSGHLFAAPSPLNARVDPGGTDEQTLTLTNTGTVPASFEIVEINAPLLNSLTRGFANETYRQAAINRLPLNSKGQRDDRATTTKNLAPIPNPRHSNRVLAVGDVLSSFDSQIAYGWGVGTSGTDIWLSNLGVAGGDDLDYRYTPDGTKTGDTIDDSGWIGDWAADGAFDARTGMIWRVNVGGDNCLYELDPVNKVATGNKICGSPWTGISQRGVAYDSAGDTFFVGGWNEGVIYHVATDGSTIDSAFVGLSISGLAYNASNGHLLVMQNFPGGDDITVLDALNNYAVLGSYPILDNGAPAITAFGGAGAEFDCLGNLWVIDQNTQKVYQVESGEAAGCAVDIPWLTVDPTEGTVAPSGGTADATVAWDALNYLPGLKLAQLQFKTDTPYAVPGIPVSMVVRFLDVPDSNQFEAFIYGAAGAGVMMGGPPNCPAGVLNFCPDNVVTRADIAGYLWRAINGALTPPPVYRNIFNDVTFNDYNSFYIQGIYNLGITAGCQANPPLYCPNNANTRAQMSVFIWKGQHGDEPPPACAGVFADVPCPGGFAVDYIEALFNEGVTAGCGGGNFCPNANITNGQMAVFLVKGFNIPHL
jgi:Carboxypeptidase regulatory-like domain/S-layer homology domain